MSASDYRYFNRELSHLAFHRRVLSMAEDPDVPLLERLRFLCISSSNLDEMFEVRVAAILEKLDHGLHSAGIDRMDLLRLLDRLRSQVREMIAAQYRLLNDELLPQLRQQGIRFYRRNHWSEAQREWLADYMQEQVLPVISPLGVDPAHPFPQIANKSLHFIVTLSGTDAFGREHRYAIVPAPRSLPRVVRLPEELTDVPYGFVFLSSIMHAFVKQLFPGMKVLGCHQFRVTRDTELYLDEEEMADLKLEVKGRLQTNRRFGRTVRLEVADECPEESINYLLEKFQLSPDQCYRCHGPVNLSRLDRVYDMVTEPALKFAPMQQAASPMLDDGNIFDYLRRRDVLLHHPFESFEPVIRLLEQAATDASVLAIRQTLYRTGSQSRIVEALCRAAQQGKDVCAVVELRARFDEPDNIQLAERMQRAGVHVVYGVVGYKTHAKMLMVVRREKKGKLVRYCHLGTGNYHGVTTRFYTDFGLLTCDPVIGNDMHLLFQQLTGLGCNATLQKLVQAPFDLHPLLIRLIEKEATFPSGRIMIKVNGLQDPELIEALYAASQQGTRIDLIVRGVCCLRPGVKGLSENIRVRSVLGRFLEHSRIYYFGNQGKPIVYASSADGMIRNLKNRVETAFPLESARLRRRIIREGLRYYLKDNCGAWRLLPDGSYRRIRPTRRSAPFSAQQKLIDLLCHSDEKISTSMHKTS